MMVTNARKADTIVQSRACAGRIATSGGSLDPMSEVHHLTRAAYDRLSAELHELTTVGRIEIAKAIERARELGDLSENGDYQAAKDQQGMMEGRIRQLQAILKDAEIVEDPAADDTVAPGMVVSIVYEGDDDDMAERYLIGHIEERHDGLDVITPGSPLGLALMGKMVGEWAEYTTREGRTFRVRVLAVEEL